MPRGFGFARGGVGGTPASHRFGGDSLLFGTPLPPMGGFGFWACRKLGGSPSGVPPGYPGFFRWVKCTLPGG